MFAMVAGGRKGWRCGIAIGSARLGVNENCEGFTERRGGDFPRAVSLFFLGVVPENSRPSERTALT